MMHRTSIVLALVSIQTILGTLAANALASSTPYLDISEAHLGFNGFPIFSTTLGTLCAQPALSVSRPGISSRRSLGMKLAGLTSMILSMATAAEGHQHRLNNPLAATVSLSSQLCQARLGPSKKECCKCRGVLTVRSYHIGTTTKPRPISSETAEIAFREWVGSCATGGDMDIGDWFGRDCSALNVLRGASASIVKEPTSVNTGVHPSTLGDGAATDLICATLAGLRPETSPHKSPPR